MLTKEREKELGLSNVNNFGRQFGIHKRNRSPPKSSQFLLRKYPTTPQNFTKIRLHNSGSRTYSPRAWN